MPQGLSPLYLVLVPVFLVLLFFRMRRAMGSRPLKLRYLWIRPLIFIAAAAAVIASAPPPMADWPWFILALVLGAAGGWQWGRTMKIHIEKDTLTATGSQAAMILFIVLLAARVALRTGLQIEARAWHIDAALMTDGFILFAAALFAVRGLEMYLRARRVMAQSRAAALSGPL